ncbi:hypothetical protein CDCA_CDCA14G3813 [Cyanidium caldarium]|uniref:Vps41 beta-propeller domain-containing protein n=1 Tax=Cyanidium caldarium TaxID=2771 RepID=A0AAV9J0C2_CYACA|nr:hypothetical protein CDCA_CDCA14G3813 [Cyanidium caldarium]
MSEDGALASPQRSSARTVPEVVCEECSATAVWPRSFRVGCVAGAGLESLFWGGAQRAEDASVDNASQEANAEVAAVHCTDARLAHCLRSWCFPGVEGAASGTAGAAVTAVDVSADGQVFCAVCSDGSIFLERARADTKRVRACRPGDWLQAVALDPTYAQATGSARIAVGGRCGELVVYGESWLGLSQLSTIHRGESAIHSVAWRGDLLAWSTADGVRVYDVVRAHGVCFLAAPAGTADAATVYWASDGRLLAHWSCGCGRVSATKRSSSSRSALRVLCFRRYLQEPQTGHGSKRVQVTATADALCAHDGYCERAAIPLDDDAARVLVLDTRQNRETGDGVVGDADESGAADVRRETLARLRLLHGNVAAATGGEITQWTQTEAHPLSVDVANGNAASIDAVTPVVCRRVSGTDATASSVFIILSSAASAPDNIAHQRVFRVRPRTAQERADWLSRQAHDDAAAFAVALQAYREAGERWSGDLSLEALADRVLQRQLDTSRLETGASRTAAIGAAVAQLPHWLGSWPAPASLWEKWVRRVIDMGHAGTVASLVPTDAPRLSTALYQELMQQLVQQPAPALVHAAQVWPVELFSVSSTVRAIEAQVALQRQNASDGSGSHHVLYLREALGTLYSRSGRHDQVLHLMLQNEEDTVFLYILRHGLYEAVRPHLAQLFEIDEDRAAETLALAPESELPTAVVLQALLAVNGGYAMRYLDRVLDDDPRRLRDPDDLELLLQLRVRHAPERVADLLRAHRAAYRPRVVLRMLEEAVTMVAEDGSAWADERAYLWRELGDTPAALRLYLQHGREEEALRLAQQADRTEVWEALITHAPHPERLLGVYGRELPYARVMDELQQRALRDVSDSDGVAATPLHSTRPWLTLARTLDERRRLQEASLALLRQHLAALQDAYESRLHHGILCPPPPPPTAANHTPR